MVTETETPEIEFLIMADRVEALNGKLYMMGGGWTDMTVVDFTRPAPFAFALGVLVPWTKANQKFPLRLWIESEDGTTIVPPFSLNIEAGRPANSSPGQSFRSVLAVNGEAVFPGPGTYRTVANLGEFASKRVSFRLRSGTVLAPVQGPRQQ
ncbi:MAG: hypothetical protein HYY02_05225 [Chloroflexi bacterium]|nr:hypothetical protein [Chloroflexota bacterium]